MKGHQMPIEEIIKKSFVYPWKNRSLWFYGLLIALFSGGSSISNNIDSAETEKIANSLNFSQSNLIALAIGFLIFILILGIIGIIVSSWAQIAIMQGTQLLEKNKKISRKEIGKTGKRPVWNLIKLNVLLPLAVLFVLAIVIGGIGYGLYSTGKTGITIGIILLVLFILSLIPLIVYLSVLFPMANRFVGLEGSKAIDSLKSARMLIKGNFWIAFLVILIMGLVVGAISFGLVLPLLLIGITIYGFWTANVTAGIALGVVIGIAYLIFYLISYGYLVAVGQTGGTLLWLELKKITK